MAGITSDDDRENSQNKGCSAQDTATKPHKEAINGHGKSFFSSHPEMEHTKIEKIRVPDLEVEGG